MTFLDGKGVCLILIGKKIESHYFLQNLQIFFHGSPDFPLSGVGRSETVLHSIESIQRRATRLICGSDKSYSERLTELNWSTLELRRKYLCLVQLYKIIHGYCDIDYTTYVDLTGPTRTRSNHDFKIRPRAARTNYFQFSFLNRYVNDWNSLPNSVVCFQLEFFQNFILNYLC